MRGRDKFDFLFKREACKRYIPFDAICLISRGLRLRDHSLLSKIKSGKFESNRINRRRAARRRNGFGAWPAELTTREI
jgi:hypothetical protein